VSCGGACDDDHLLKVLRVHPLLREVQEHPQEQTRQLRQEWMLPFAEKYHLWRNEILL
jgi:hypothetical protein